MGQKRGSGPPEGSPQLVEEHHCSLQHQQGAGHGSVSGCGGLDQWDGFPDLSGGCSVAHAKAGPGGGDGQLECPQGERVRELIEAKGCELLYLPPYSPDYNPIEQAFSKLKSYLRDACARSQQALMEVIGEALRTISTSDALGFFEHCGYRAVVQSL